MDCYSLVFALTAIVSALNPYAYDTGSEKAALLKRDAEWSAAASAGKDVKKIVSYWSDDAIVLAPGQPAVKGKKALIAFVTGSLKTPGFHIQWKSSDVEFSPDHKMAYMSGKNQITVPGADGKLMTLAGRGITIWRKDADGKWRCVVDIWNEPPPKS